MSRIELLPGTAIRTVTDLRFMTDRTHNSIFSSPCGDYPFLHPHRLGKHYTLGVSWTAVPKGSMGTVIIGATRSWELGSTDTGHVIALDGFPAASGFAIRSIDLEIVPPLEALAVASND